MLAQIGGERLGQWPVVRGEPAGHQPVADLATNQVAGQGKIVAHAPTPQPSVNQCFTVYIIGK